MVSIGGLVSRRRARKMSASSDATIETHMIAGSSTLNDCHSVISGRLGRTVVARNRHRPTPYGFPSVARRQPAPSPSHAGA